MIFYMQYRVIENLGRLTMKELTTLGFLAVWGVVMGGDLAGTALSNLTCFMTAQSGSDLTDCKNKLVAMRKRKHNDS